MPTAVRYHNAVTTRYTPRAMPTTLHHLTLVPTPLSAVPDPDDSAFEQELIDEGRRLLSHDGWTERKSWHGGVVETYSLPQGSVTYEPKNGGGGASPSPTGKSGEEGILWHKRVSRFKASEHGGYDTWWKAVGENHIEQEKEYVDNLVKVIDIGKSEGKKDCFLKLYKLPFGATDRSFMTHSVVVSPSSSTQQPSSQDPNASSSSSPPESKSKSSSPSSDGPREFLVFSLPITTQIEVPEEKKYVRGTQATVERVRELEGGEIEWSCASLSTPGGNIPVKLSEGKMAASLADAVPSILTWMSSKYPPNASSIKSGTYSSTSDASARKPAQLRTTKDAANPGGGMGVMPAGRLPLELFRKPVKLRETELRREKDVCILFTHCAILPRPSSSSSDLISTSLPPPKSAIMGIYIPSSKRDRLLKYKYSSTDLSLTSRYILNPYWNRLVLLFPKNMAPNAITLLGLSLIFLNFLSLLYYNPTLSTGTKPLHVSKGGTWDPLFPPTSTHPSILSSFFTWLTGRSAADLADQGAPRWLYWTFAVGLFMYQSLDAIDGKQARRTGTSGPLGELFDHGCDALNTTLGCLLCASSLNLGLSWWTVASLIATHCNFMLTTWEEFHTGTLFLSAFSGPVEGILLIVAIFAVTGFKGPQFWDTGVLTALGLHPSTNSLLASLPFQVKDLPINDLFLCFSAIGLLFNIVAAIHNVYLSLPAESRNILHLFRPLTRLSPYIIHTAAMLSWLHSRERLLLRTTLFIPFALFWGISFAHHVQLLILAHLTKSPFPAAWKHPLLLLAVLAAVDAHFGIVQTDKASVKHTVLACLAIGTLVYAHFVWEVIGDICAFYDIGCLTIKRKPAPGTPGYQPSPAEIARKQGKADEPIKEDGVPLTHEVDKTGRKVPTEAGLLKRQKGE
ncbi:putative CDP-alcohol phosphatidyltransferase class-I family protein C22A12.10 [Rhodotorula toruloides]|nr:putative CDP-alcohol phosphatidyltransferase class-I family protein C22A12.10 [Rhodotorula toruloides]